MAYLSGALTDDLAGGEETEDVPDSLAAVLWQKNHRTLTTLLPSEQEQYSCGDCKCDAKNAHVKNDHDGTAGATLFGRTKYRVTKYRLLRTKF